MTSVPLLLNTTDKAITFAREIGKYEEDMDLEGGKTYIDAKSMIGIFSLNLKNPVTLHIHADGRRAAEIMNELNAYVCKKENDSIEIDII